MCAVSQIVKYQVMTKLDTVNEMCKILFGFKKTYHCNVMCIPQTVAFAILSCFTGAKENMVLV